MGSDKFMINHEEWSSKIETSIEEDNNSFKIIVDTYLQFLSYENNESIEISNIKIKSKLLTNGFNF